MMLEQYYKIKGVIARYVVSSNLKTNFEIYNSILEKCFMVDNKVFDYSAKTVDNSVEYSAFHQNLPTAIASQQDLNDFINSYHLGYFTYVLSLYQRCVSESFSIDPLGDFANTTVKSHPATLLLDEVGRVLTYSKLALVNGKRIDLDELEIDEFGIHGYVGAGSDSMKIVIGWDLFLFTVAKGE